MTALRIISISTGFLLASIAVIHASTDGDIWSEELSGPPVSVAEQPVAEQPVAERPAEVAVAQRSRRRKNSGRFELRGDLKVESGSEAPRVCLRFTQAVKAPKDVNYGDYVRFEPKIASTFIARGKRLCVEGPEHGTIYKVTVLKGLPAASGTTYTETENFTVSVPDRAPTVNFGGAAYILPRGGNREFALNSVNVTKAKLSVIRINDRNLIQEINRGRISKLLSRYDAANIASTSGESIWKGTVEIDSKRNKKVTTAIPISGVMLALKPGIYAIVATPEESTNRGSYGSSTATQWFVFSDLGLSTYRGADGLHVFVRSLDSAKPAAGVKLRLIARNNEVLGSAVTNATGTATFAPGLMQIGRAHV